MTFKEKYTLDHPNGDSLYKGCPANYSYCEWSYLEDDKGQCKYTCESCWNQEIPDTTVTISDAEKWAKDLREKYQKLRHEGFTGDEALMLLTAYLKGGNHNG